MSFILDALRKSETERQRQSTPGLVDAGYRPPARRRAIWLPILVVVLVANLVLMGVFWMRREAQPAAGPPAAPAVAVAPQPAAPAPVGGSLAAAAGVSTPADSEYEATADLPAVDGKPVTETLPPPPAAATPNGTTGPGAASRFVTEGLPSADQLMASGAIPQQALHLDIHVFSTTPAERFVFINMRKYAEGAQLPEGPKIEEITRDGVVLSQAGQHFVLTRD